MGEKFKNFVQNEFKKETERTEEKVDRYPLPQDEAVYDNMYRRLKKIIDNPSV